MIARAASADSTVLVTGETGCGKEEIVRAIHARGRRASRPLIAVNCGAMAPSLIESQLFGHEKGSFTAALGALLGVSRAANGGTVLLDEIGEMPLELQPRLLRVLQEREVMPIGSTAVPLVDVLVIAATNRCLRSAVRAGSFREDLYFRGNTIEIDLPPLRDRAEDIPLFVGLFCSHFAVRFGAENCDRIPRRSTASHGTTKRTLYGSWPRLSSWSTRSANCPICRRTGLPRRIGET